MEGDEAPMGTSFLRKGNRFLGESLIIFLYTGVSGLSIFVGP